jgi:hypothetical protein
MPNVIYEIEAAGQVFEIEGPEGLSEADLAPVVQNYLSSQPSAATAPGEIPSIVGQEASGAPILEQTQAPAMAKALPAQEVAAETTPQAEGNMLIEGLNSISRNFNRGVFRAFGLEGVGRDVRAFPAGEAETPIERGIQTAGEAMGLVGAGVGAGRVLINNLRGKGWFAGTDINASTFENILSSFYKNAARNPGLVTGGEASAAFSAGAVGEYVADRSENSVVGRAIGEVAGGLAPAGAAGAAGAFAKVSPVIRMLQNLATGSGGAGRPEGRVGFEEAAQRLSQAEPRGVLALRRTVEDELSPEARALLPAALQANSPGILDLNAYLLQKGAPADSRDLLRAQQSDLLDGLNSLTLESSRRMAPEGMAPAQERFDPDVAVDYMRYTLDAAVEAAQLEALNSINILPKIDRTEVNKAARAAIDEAYDAASRTENSLWSAVPTDIRTTANNSYEVVKDILMRESLTEVKGKRLPTDVYNLLARSTGSGKGVTVTAGKFVMDGTSVGDLQRLRSKLLGIARKERGKPGGGDKEYLKNLGEIQEALLTDMSAVEGASDALKVARGFSKSKNEKFNQGIVGKIRGYDTTGTKQVSPGLTLEKTIISPRDMSAKDNFDNILLALRSAGDEGGVNTQEFVKMAGDLVLNDFKHTAISGGDFSLAKAQGFVNRNRNLLDTPEMAPVKARIQEAINKQDAYLATAEVLDPAKSAVGVWLKKETSMQGSPETGLRRIRNSPNPGRATRQIVEEIQKIPDPAARTMVMGGFRQSLVDSVINEATSSRGIVGGSALKTVLDNPRTKAQLMEGLTADQRRRLNQFRNDALQRERIEEARPSAAGLIRANDPLWAQIASRVGFAELGRRVSRGMGGGTIQTPGIFVSLGNTLRDRGLDPARGIVRDAILGDEELLKALLSKEVIKVDSPQYNKIYAWFLNTGTQAMGPQFGELAEKLREEEKKQGSTLQDPEPPL